MPPVVDLNRNVPRLGLNRLEVAMAIGVSANTVDQMVEEGVLPKPRKWHTRKIWLVSDISAAMASWPEDGHLGKRAEVDDGWRASV